MFGTFNSERLEEFIDIMNKYKDPNTNVVDGNNPDYLAEVAALNQKYAPAQTQTQQQQAPAQTQTQQAPVQAQAQAQQAPEEDTIQKMYLTSNQGNIIPGVQRGSSFIYMIDENTGKSYTYDDNEGKSGDTGFLSAPPPDAKLKITGINSKRDEDFVFKDLTDLNLTFGGVTDPETLKQYEEQAAKDDPGDNDLFYDYTDPKTGKTRTYVDVSGTGRGIPTGATNITRDPTQLGGFDDQGNPVKYDPSTYTSPVLAKGFTSYFDQTNPVEFQQFQEDKKPPFGIESLSFDNVFSIKPSGTVIDTGIKNPFPNFIQDPFSKENITISNPPTQLQNLEPFFNQAEAFGYENFKKRYDEEPGYFEKLFGIQPVPKSTGEIIQDTGGSSVAPPGEGKDPDPPSGGGGGGGADPDPDPDKDKPKRTTFFAPAKRSDPISTAPDEPINTDPRFQPIFPQQPIQPIGPIEGGPVEGLFPVPTQPQAGPIIPQPEPIPIEAKPPFMPIVSPTPQQPQTFADVMHRGGAKGPPGINPYFQDIEQINRTAPYTSIMGIATNPMMLKDGGGIMSLRNRMLMAPASQAMTKGIMS
jgi:hypothetical protein